MRFNTVSTRRPRWAVLLAGACAALVSTLLGAAPAEARWLRAESPKFIVYSDGDEMRLREQVQQLEMFDAVLRATHNLDPKGVPPRKLTIYLVKDHASLARMWPSEPQHVAGVYNATPGDISAIAIRDSKETTHRAANQDTWEESTLFHEYTHHFMLQNFPFGFPTWLIEGYAEYYGASTVDGGHIETGKFSNGRVYELDGLPWLPMQDVLGKRLDQIPEKQWGMFYAQSWLLTHYLKSDPARSRQIITYMVDVGKGGDPVAAMQRATGMDMTALTQALHAYLKGRLNFTVLNNKSIATPEIAVTAMPPSADALILEAEHVRHGVDRGERDSVLKIIREKAAAFPDDRLAQITLAHVEIKLGDRKTGEAILDRLIAKDPNDAEALELAGQSRLDAGDQEKDYDKTRADYQASQSFIARAFKLDPNRYQTLSTYARSRRLLDQSYPSDNTLEALLAALDFAPQVAEIRFEAAEGMMRRKRWAEARSIITPLANDPHNPGGARAARDLLERINDEAAAEARTKGG